MTTRRAIAVTSLAGYGATIFAANWLITTYGVVDVAPGPWSLFAPAGVYAVGAALVLRDLAHDTAGVWWVLAAIAAGVALSAAVASPGLVFASAAAFGLSELLDLAVYTPLRDHGWTVAAVVSSAVGLVVDSLVFLWLAFGSLAFIPGQIVGKSVAVLIAVAVGAGIRSALHPHLTSVPA